MKQRGRTSVTLTIQRYGAPFDSYVRRIQPSDYIFNRLCSEIADGAAAQYFLSLAAKSSTVKYRFGRKMATIARTLRPFLRSVRSHARSYADAPTGDQMKFTFAGANQVFYDSAVVRQVDVPSFSGSFGILPKHVPTLAVLKPGVVTVYEQSGETKKVFVSSGTVTINEDSSVQILAEEAHPVENLDSGAAKDILSKAQQQLSSATSEKDKAEAAIAVEVAEALVSAAQ